MHRIPRLALILGGMATAQLAVSSAHAQDPNKPSTQTGNTGSGSSGSGSTGSGSSGSGQTGTMGSGQSGTHTGVTGQTGSMDREKMGKSDDEASRFTDRDLTDSELANKIHAINLHEIEMANLAKSQATSKDVKDFANKLLKDHQDADKKLTDVSKKMGIDLRSPSDAMDSEHQAKMQRKTDELKSFTGADFDRHFLVGMQEGHDHAILMLTAQAFTHPIGKDLRDLVKKQMPTLNDHRKKAIDLLEKIADKTPPTS